MSLYSPSQTASQAISAALRQSSPLIQSTQVPRWGADGKGEYRDEQLPNEDPARYRRLRRSRTGRPESRGLGRCDRLRAARGARRSGAHFPEELSWDSRLLWQALRADRRGVQGAAPETVVAGEGRRGHRGRGSPQDGGGGPGDRGLGRGAPSGPDRYGQ